MAGRLKLAGDPAKVSWEDDALWVLAARLALTAAQPSEEQMSTLACIAQQTCR